MVYAFCVLPGVRHVEGVSVCGTECYPLLLLVLEVSAVPEFLHLFLKPLVF